MGSGSKKMNNEFTSLDADEHCAIKLKGELFLTKTIIELGDLRNLWSEANDATRLEIIKSVIWTAPDIRKFLEKTLKVLNSEGFQYTID